MKAILCVEHMTVDIGAGGEIGTAITEAIELAGANRCLVSFDFNGTRITVNGNSDREAIGRAWGELLDARAKSHGAEVLHDGTVKWGTNGR